MNWRKWLDEFGLAGKGILLATKEKRFWYGFIPSFFFFGMLMNLLSSGTTKFELMFTLGFPNDLKILGDAFLAIFGVGQAFLDWLPIFSIAILQGILIGIIVLLWNKKRSPEFSDKKSSAKAKSPAKTTTVAKTTKNTKLVKSAKSTQSTPKTSSINASDNSANLERAGLITGLIALGAGCPTCGVTLLTPLLGAIFSTGSLAIAGTISTIVTWLAVIIAILSLKRLGMEVYVIIINEKYLARKRKKESNEKFS